MSIRAPAQTTAHEQAMIESQPPTVDNAILSGDRVIIVLCALELGGSERQALLLARYLKDVQKAHLEVWGFQQPGQVTELCNVYGIPWRIVPLSWNQGRHPPLTYISRLAALVRLAAALRKARPTIILPYTMLPNVACGLVWHWTGAQICLWNQRDEGVHRLEHWPEQRAVRSTPFFLANSQGNAGFLIHTLGVKPELVRVIRNGVVLNKPLMDRNEWRARLNVNEYYFVACMAANLHVNKDHATLVRSWRLVMDRLDSLGQPAVLLLAGRYYDTYEPLQELCRNLKLNNSVKFLGPVEDIAGLLQATDLAVLSSRSEGCPNSVLEAMAAGLAVTGTDIPGIREALGPQSESFLAPPGDAAALARQIITLALDPELRARLGQANLERLKTEFSPRKMCEHTLSIMVKARQMKTGIPNKPIDRLEKNLQPTGKAYKRLLRAPFHTVANATYPAKSAFPRVRQAYCLWRYQGAHRKRIEFEFNSDHEKVHQALGAIPQIHMKRMRVEPGLYHTWLRQAGYPPNVYQGNFAEKTLEHYLSVELLKLKPSDVVIDVASANSPFVDVIERTVGCKIYEQDLVYAPGVNGRRIGGNAAQMPLPDSAVNKITLHCSFEHFEGHDDSAFIRECGRLLSPGGQCTIVPLYVVERRFHLTNPLCSDRSGLVFDPRTPVIKDPRWAIARFSRFYDVESFEERIVAHLSDRLQATLYFVENEKEVDPSCYVKFILLLTKR